MKKKLLFVFDHQFEDIWRDGLWAALELLKEDFELTKCNLNTSDKTSLTNKEYDFVLAWGAFNSSVTNEQIESLPGKHGLCIGGNGFPPERIHKYDVLFHETKWYRPQIKFHKNIVHAFGVNTNIYKPNINVVKIYDYLTVGAYALWKRQDHIIYKPGIKLAVGQIQRENEKEYLAIAGKLLANHVAVSDMVPPETLAMIYNASKNVFIPADINGGGERAVLEARACNVHVEIEDDNPKLKELIESPVYDHIYYYNQLKKGILSTLE